MTWSPETQFLIRNLSDGRLLHKLRGAEPKRMARILARIQTPEWEYIRQEEAGNVSAQVSQHARVQYRTWNSRIDSLEPTLQALAAAAAAATTSDPSQAAALEVELNYDLGKLVFVTEFQEVGTSRVWNALREVYLDGDLPIGLDDPIARASDTT